MVARRSYSARERIAIWDRCRGEQEFPICNICGLSVFPGQAWDVSHDPQSAPAALGGDAVGIAHRRCNRRHGAVVVTPLVAKIKRIRAKHIGAHELGRSRHAMPCGRASPWRKKLSGKVVRRTHPFFPAGLSCLPVAAGATCGPVGQE
jgi:hypothetical protein